MNQQPPPPEDPRDARERRSVLLAQLERQEVVVLDLEAEHDKLNGLADTANRKARNAWRRMREAKEQRDKTRHQLIAALPQPMGEPVDEAVAE